MINRNVVTILDGAAGSCGKAKVIGEFANERNNLGAAITNCMPNAGHTYVDKKGNSYVFQNIPVAAVNEQTELFIGPGSAIDTELFRKEYALLEPFLKNRRIYVHELVPLIEPHHKEYEKMYVKSGSTFKGCGAVMRDKIMRDPNLRFFSGYKNAVRVSNEEYLNRIYEHLDNPYEYVLLEGAQGCDLSLNHSSNYPFVTSRNVSASQLLADSGISPSRHLGTILVIRPFPIRISNITNDHKVIYTGWYGTGKELTWTQINLAAKCGFYPIECDFELYPNNFDDGLKMELLSKASKVSLMQIFGCEFEQVNLADITILDALEMERLINKEKGIREYISNVVDFSDLGDPVIKDLSEITTVTKMERRIFDLDIEKLRNNCRINDPMGIYLNFFQHLDLQYADSVGNFDMHYINRYLREYLNWIEENTGCDIIALGTGNRDGQRINVKSLKL